MSATVNTHTHTQPLQNATLYINSKEGMYVVFCPQSAINDDT